jgi:transcriptional regulator with XRE-family HTH domain
MKIPTYSLSGVKLRAARESLAAVAGRPITQKEIAEAAGMAQPNYARLESTDSNPGINMVMRIAVALRASVESLIVSDLS